MLRQRANRRRLIGWSLFGTAISLLPAFGGRNAARAQDAPLLIVDDEQTANPDLLAVDLTVPDGFEAPGSRLMLPKGFAAEVLASGLAAPRFMAFDDAGNLLVADQEAGAVYRYPANGAGAIDPAGYPSDPLVSGLDAPSSVALYQDGDTLYLYVGETSQVSRFPYDPAGPVGASEVVIPDLPAGGHRTRTVLFLDDKLYLSIGSSCNICVEDDDRRAAITRYNPDGSGEERYAWGLRNAVGLAVQPDTDTLWATVNERDNQGNEIPPDLVTIVEEGADYGWPDCQPPNATPQEAGNDCAGVTPPTVAIQAHSAPLGLAFATGNQFPRAYRDGLFVAQHGSWNREPPAAPKLLYVTFEDGQPTAAADFATGWQDENGNRWGRPAGVIVAPDGSLIVSDDQAGVLYRISYKR